MEANTPFISVIIPVYNGKATIARTIESLLVQTLPRKQYEIIVVDNASTDSSSDVIRCYDVRYTRISPPNRSVARNHGASAANGELLFFIDCDCIASPDWLESLSNELADGQHAAVQGFITPQGAAKVSYSHCPHTHLGRPYLDTKGCAVRRSIFASIGGFDERLSRCEDIDLSWKLYYGGHGITFLDATGVECGLPRGFTTTLMRSFESARGLRQVHTLWKERLFLSIPSVYKGFLMIGKREAVRRFSNAGLPPYLRLLYLLDGVGTAIFYTAMTLIGLYALDALRENNTELRGVS